MKKVLNILFLFFISLPTLAQEICDNGIDDDGDGLADLLDPDCECAGFSSSQTVPSLIPNSSFEDHSCCPSGYSQLNCADTWIQASGPTSDYWHDCGSAYAPAYGAPSGPKPDGAGIAGFIDWNGYKEYVGACLLSPMLAGNTYDLNFYLGFTASSSATFDVTFYGTTTCADLPFGNGCPVGQGNWTQLGQVTLTNDGSWQNATVTFTPSVDIYAMVIGPPCPNGPSNIAYYYIDGLTLAETSLFSSLTIDTTGSWCTNDLNLVASSDTTGGTWQWYQDSVALIGQTNQTLDISGNGLGPGNYQAQLTLGSKCETQNYTITIPPNPVSSFTVSDTCFPALPQFTDQSTITAPDNIVAWSWDFGNGNTSSQQNPTTPYSTNGTYTVSLTTTSSQNCTNTISQSVTVYAEPSASFDVNFSSNGLNAPGGCLYETIDFTDNSTINSPDNITTWEWDFGDGNTSNTQNPTHQYATEGNYTVQLIITSNNGCTDTVSTTLDIYPVPVASYTTNDVCIYTSATFVESSTITSGNITNWDWDFNDANNSTLQNPTHLYSVDGNYTPQLIVTSDFGCKDTTTSSITIFPTPQSNFTAFDACIYDSASFMDQSSINAPDNIVNWNWDFGDGNTSTNQNPSHLYATTGSYDVQLLTTSNNGCVDSVLLPVRIFSKPVADYSTTDVCLGTPTLFNDNSTVAGDIIATWEWDFGNGQNSSNQSIAYTYPVDGSYTTELIVTSSKGCKDTIQNPVTVFPIPNTSFSFQNDCYYNPISFSDLSTINTPDNISTWEWDFGDGSATNSAQNPTHTFPNSGNFIVNLTTTSNNGCSSNLSQPIEVYPQPNPSFIANPTCINTPPMNFTDASSINSGNIVTWNWNFGDGTTSSLQFPNNTYLNPGVYNVQLTVTSNQGCEDSISVPVVVNNKPNANFEGDLLEDCTPVCVNFSDLTVANSDSLSTWFWILGNSEASLDSTANTCYENPSNTDDMTYDVTLIVSNSLGCYDTITKYDYITSYHYPIASFINTPEETNMYETSIQFTNNSIGADNYSWNFGDSTYGTSVNPEHNYTDTGSYEIQLIASTDHLCADTTYGSLIVNAITNIYIPNSFTPNGDGKNDLFFFEGYGIVLEEFEFVIFNRWGELIYQTNSFSPWDGNYKNSPAQQDVYVYRLRCKDVYGEYYEYTGHVNLIR